MSPPTHISILGGGITALSSAFHLSRRYPTSLITLVDKSPRLGGWVRSQRVKLPSSYGGDEVLLEAGPRSLRGGMNSKAVLELINLLNLSSELTLTPTTSPAAKNRFLHIPGTHGLTPIPSSLLSLPTSPLAGTILPAALREPFRRSNRPVAHPALEDSDSDSDSSLLNLFVDGSEVDESFDAFLTRRFGPRFARILGSALVHGVYAADSRQLSVRAAFPSLYDMEEIGWGSVGRGIVLREFFGKTKKKTKKEVGGGLEASEYELGGVPKVMKATSVYSFKNGLETLSRALESWLRTRNNVRIVQNSTVTSLEMDEDHNIKIHLSNSPPLHTTHIISALPLPTLNTILSPSPPSLHLPHLTTNPYNSVTVINLVLPSSPSSPLHPPGFGYLIPRPEDGYEYETVRSERLGGGVLGVVFDSCAVQNQDSGASGMGKKMSGDVGKGYTKLTVMLGGPYRSSSSSSSQATTGTTSQIDVPLLLSTLGSHLSPTSSSSSSPSSPKSLPDPIAMEIHENNTCIPCYLPGHVGRMDDLRRILRGGGLNVKEKETGGGGWGGRLEVIGAGVGGVSVGDCVEAGRRAGLSWSE